MKIIGVLLMFAIFGFVFLAVSRNLGVRDTIEVFALAALLSTLLEVAFWLMTK